MLCDVTMSPAEAVSETSVYFEEAATKAVRFCAQ
jgi:hypothetical protein